MTFIPRPQEIYKHFKGNLYQVAAVAEHTETGEMLVIYQAMYGDFKMYARPLAMFTSKVDREKYPDVAQVFRFELQGPGAERQLAESEDTVSVKTAETVSGEKPVPETVQAEKVTAQSSQTTSALQEEDKEEEAQLDPMLLEFLDADSCEARLNVLTGMRHRITDSIITTMAIACDLEVGNGTVEEKYDQLRSCLLTKSKYESNRPR